MNHFLKVTLTNSVHTSLTGTPTDVNQNKAYEEIMKRFNDSIIPFETHGRLSRGTLFTFIHVFQFNSRFYRTGNEPPSNVFQ